MDDKDPKSIFEAVKSLFADAKPQLDDVVAGFANMVGGAEKLIKTFGVGRQRMEELMGSITDATPVVDRLGGNLTDAVTTIQKVSEATRRNVAAGAEDISKLYSASQVLGGEYGLDIERLVGSFQEIGVEFTQVGSQLENSIQYIQSVGGNVEKIMSTVMNDMSVMNRFNFQDGVVGVTKMAAQAAMLKTDMRVTMELAEKALDPEGAIELASAFQRLGVSASDLTDPFQLMNKSLNDPEGLQNSIVNMSKQFAYFDEKANQFKINPQGMLMMRELQKQTGLSSVELSKMALNAAELDKKLSEIRPDIQFASEEDKKYLANIAKMGKGGKYEVKMGDDYFELEKLSQKQIDDLIDEQKKGPKTLEDLQRSQLDAFTLVKNDVRALKDKFVLGIVSTPQVREGAEGVRGVMTSASGALEESLELKTVRAGAEKSMDVVRNLISKMSKGEFFSADNAKDLENAMKDLKSMEGKLDEGMRSIVESFLEKNASNNTEIGRIAQKFLEKEYSESDLKARGSQQTPQQAQSSINMNQSEEIRGEIKTTSSSIIGKIDGVSNKIDGMTTAQPSSNPNQTTTDIVREITSVVKQGQVKVEFQPVQVDLKLSVTSDGKIDNARLENALLFNTKIQEDLAKIMGDQFKKMNIVPFLQET